MEEYSGQITFYKVQILVHVFLYYCNPPSCGHFGHHGTKNFGEGDLINFIKNVSLNQKSWLPNGDQKNLTWRVVHDTAKFKNIPALSQKSCSLNFAF